MILKAIDVANYLLTLSNEDEGDLVSNLKIQKLAYYCQGFHLAIYDEPIFSEKISHWDHGPVVKELYHEYKQFGSGPLPVPKDIDLDIYSESQKDTMNEVFLAYGQFSAWRLRELTHNEPPWKETETNEEISHEVLKKYFLTQLINE